MEWTCGLLAAAVVALWASPGAGPGWRALWLWCAGGAVAAALAAGVVQPAGLLGIAGWTGLIIAWSRRERWPRPVRAGLGLGILGLAAALMLHRLPGFVNPRVIDAVRFTPDAAPFSLYVNFDKTLIALGLLGFAHARIASAREWRGVLAATWPRALAVLGVVLAASLALGYVRWAPKLPAQTAWFLGVNLLFTCPAEEALFRGFIQGGLRRVWADRRGGAWVALAVGAVLFGLAHAAGGWAYVALATIAGAGYGWIYERTQRVEAGVLAHFALNTVHFFLFTYPALAP